MAGDKKSEKLGSHEWEQTQLQIQRGFEADMMVHDLSNTIGGLIGYAQLAEMTQETQDLLECARRVNGSLQEGKQRITDFKTRFGGSRTPVILALRPFIEALAQELADEWGEDGPQLMVDVPSRLMIGEKLTLRRVLMALLTNVAAHAKSGEKVSIKAAVDGGELVLTLGLEGHKAVENSELSVTYPLRGDHARQIEVDVMQMNGVHSRHGSKLGAPVDEMRFTL
ncbi:MAG: HAMP domain-containing histidine kinase [Deltaproteobacteria bacterium]|nr:HAMP domain-containing histidine kinase [Deltaproteobacteria bacterium]MCB9488989.1 HAMP domain-containing histidine kinase [Deltaproteobacteria bacterium]